MVQSVTICVLALWVTAVDEERRTMNHEERMWGYTGAAGMVQALATGYFLFDLAVMVRYLDVFGVGMLTHASSCLVTYTLGFPSYTTELLLSQSFSVAASFGHQHGYDALRK
ncbi:putative Uncharacterized TLC domain-containing protein C17A2.02c [Glarea lozoyensis 74030]|uniref:Putative Uncharacterized TLC domain-containing protein C17A2.02c n=1 Tax=Glarea lozoyensis (strain ATCC 74030 / MF5533) TaxID=1104152 RepID=H0EFD7_GLAL7|nr:putative Uncharacterized TLC domain-containing protein C17A2.02c [Glarea lozoyensis 74030]